jgi:hypothetical protein
MCLFRIKFASFLPFSAINSNCYQCSIGWPSFACWTEHFAQLEHVRLMIFIERSDWQVFWDG